MLNTQSISSLEREILNLVMRYRRSHPSDPCMIRPCNECYSPHLKKVRNFIFRGAPIHFIFPSFPAKSSNKMKVLGALPDMAERIAINFLEECCRRIQAIYPPGARITICSDGRIFSDLVRIGEDDVTAYMGELQGLIDELGAGSLDIFSIDDAFDITDFEEQRQELLLRHAIPVEELHRLVKSGDPLLFTFNGVARFLFEDIFAIDGCRKSRNAIRTETKSLAYRVIQRSLAWSALIAERFPRAVRLSIHPHPPHSEKIGIYLVETLDNWLSPWHGVAVDIGGQYVLMKRYEAESLGASLVWLNGRPSHFVLGRDRDREESFSFARAF